MPATLPDQPCVIMSIFPFVSILYLDVPLSELLGMRMSSVGWCSEGAPPPLPIIDFSERIPDISGCGNGRSCL
jgi:hypothetical protein